MPPLALDLARRVVDPAPTDDLAATMATCADDLGRALLVAPSADAGAVPRSLPGPARAAAA